MIRTLLAIAVVLLGFNVGARLQVFDGATFVSSGQPERVYVGRVSRTLLHGDWVIDQADGARVMFPDSDFGVLVAPSGGITVASGLTALLGLVIGVGMLLAGSTLLAERRRSVSVAGATE